LADMAKFIASSVVIPEYIPGAGIPPRYPSRITGS
jgi:hypothetical protein